MEGASLIDNADILSMRPLMAFEAYMAFSLHNFPQVKAPFLDGSSPVAHFSASLLKRSRWGGS
jgi:hypothetical protein